MLLFSYLKSHLATLPLFYLAQLHVTKFIKKERKKVEHHQNISKIPSREIVETDKIDYPNTQNYDCLLSWLSIGTSVKGWRTGKRV
jgi:hypothetical protein